MTVTAAPADKTCEYCGNSFPRQPYHTDTRWARARFCSHECSNRDPVRNSGNTGSNRVPVEQLATAFHNSGLTYHEVAERAGITKHTPRGLQPDGSTVAALLGLRAQGKYTRQTVSYDNAVRLCRAIGADPIDVGI